MSTIKIKIKEDWHSNFMSHTAFGIILSTCLGGVAVMTTLQQGLNFSSLFQLFLIVIVCNMFNASILTVQKPGIVFKTLALSVITNLLIILYSFTN